MMNFFSEYQTGTMDLALDFYGYEDCPPLYSFGPAIREIFVLHYVTKGKGTFYYQNQAIQLRTGDLFLLKPNLSTFYQADAEDPWSYYWIGLSGTKIEDYFQVSTLFEKAYFHQQKPQETGVIAQLMSTLVTQAQQLTSTTTNHLYLLGKLYDLLFELGKLAPRQTKPKYSQTQKLYLDAKYIMETRYNLESLSIAQIAQELNVHRSYLTTVFKSFNSFSPKEFLQHVRLERGRQLLLSTEESVKIIALSVGFSDALYFSKVFKQLYQVSPSQLRKKYQAQRTKPSSPES